MRPLHIFLTYLCGSFDNREQLENCKDHPELPFAVHINTVCNEKIQNLPEYFDGAFVLEESYYTVGNSTRAMPHLFLFQEDSTGNIVLTSYGMPKEYTKETFRFDDSLKLDYHTLEVSTKFQPLTYYLRDGIFVGENSSMFTPVLKFSLSEKISQEQLEVQETMEVQGKRTFGYDVPIIYRRRALDA